MPRLLLWFLTLHCAAAVAATVPVVEFHHAGLAHYFRTASRAEAEFIDNGGAGPGWVRTARDFLAWPDAANAPAAAAAVCRFYGTPNVGPNSHFYTAAAAECAWVRTLPEWTYEGIAFHALPAADGSCAADLQPVWRNYNDRWGQNDANHRYSTDPNVYQSMITAGWVGEGVVMCVPKAATSPVDEVAYTGTFPETAGGFMQADLALDGQVRSAWVYRPPAAANPPLMLFFTGTGGTLQFSALDELGRATVEAFANQHGLAMIFPLPRRMDRGDWDNHDAGTPYWETAVAEGIAALPSSDMNVNPDLRFVRALLAEAARAWGVDTRRIYSNGFSNGAFFAYFVANVLRDRIAGFGQTGGGLVRSHTTFGEPSACLPTVLPGGNGTARTCAASGWTPTTCVASDAMARPLAVPVDGRLPAAFIEANDDDTSVPYAHSCNLAAALPDSVARTVRIIHQGGGHIVNEGYLERSWQFLQGFALTP